MRFRLLAPSGSVLDEGDGDARVESGALVVTPTLGQPIRVRPVDVVDIGEPAPYFVQLRLREGPALELSQLGALRTQILAQFAHARAEQTVDALLLGGVGTPATFPGAVDGIEAQLRLYDDVLVAIPVSGEPRQLRYAAIDAIDTDASGYKITVGAAGSPPITVQRLAARTSEFLKVLHERVNAARLRSATLIATLLPGLGSLASRSVAALLRDGVPAAARELDAIEPTVSASLLRAATLADRTPCVAALAARGELWLALHQVASVEVAASGDGELSAPVTQVREHGGIASAPGGLAGVMTGAVLAGGPNLFGIGPGAGLLGGGGAGAAGAAGPLGGLAGAAVLGGVVGSMMGSAGGAGGLLGAATPLGAQHDVAQRHVPGEGGPGGPGAAGQAAHTDYDRLSTGGGEPTVYGMVFAVISDKNAVVYEVLNDADHATYVYDLPASSGGSGDGVRALAEALALIGFRVSAVYSDASGADSKFRDAVERLPYLAMLRSAFRGRVIHTENWESQLDALLAAR